MSFFDKIENVTIVDMFRRVKEGIFFRRKETFYNITEHYSNTIQEASLTDENILAIAMFNIRPATL